MENKYTLTLTTNEAKVLIPYAILGHHLVAEFPIDPLYVAEVQQRIVPNLLSDSSQLADKILHLQHTIQDIEDAHH